MTHDLLTVLLEFGMDDQLLVPQRVLAVFQFLVMPNFASGFPILWWLQARAMPFFGSTPLTSDKDFAPSHVHHNFSARPIYCSSSAMIQDALFES
jgi:hypothetical protein